ncbi:hypothetical protein F53441_12665 [Fusarium austroafricanum]|uniref:Zn(2)-C6 fungal-type domain-containing protein n=1 Tax=Fusarium austroafricanum TaxID=2364996 RepID=A0A8H4JX18_9HYPO|nr:hypothetical protein F53441_12665 [Fusarium austroafricanum]
MAGVPTGRGCDGCRKQKKKCDQAKPACSRCTRLKLKCTGSGVKRFMFKSENSQAAGRSKAVVTANPQPSSGLSNDKTLTAANLVHIIDLDNPGYDISTYGWFVKDLPRHIGSSKPLDAAITAFVTGFGTMRDKNLSKVNALDRYVYALKALRESMQDPVQAFSTDNMCSIYLISICQEWLGHGNGCDVGAKHHEVLGHLLQNAVLNSQFDPSNKDFMQTIFAVVVLASFTNPNIELGSWFWQAFSLLGTADRPLKSGDAESAVAQARKSGSTSLERRLGIRFHTGSAAMLTMAVIINRVLRSYEDDTVLLEEAKRREEVEKYLVEYQSDFPGLTYFGDVELIRKKFENIDRNNERKARLLLESERDLSTEFDNLDTRLETGGGNAEFNSLDTGLEAGAGCTIL